MHILTEIRHLCKRYRISHQISVRDAASLGSASPYENLLFQFQFQNYASYACIRQISGRCLVSVIFSSAIYIYLPIPLIQKKCIQIDLNKAKFMSTGITAPHIKHRKPQFYKPARRHPHNCQVPLCPLSHQGTGCVCVFAFTLSIAMCPYAFILISVNAYTLTMVPDVFVSTPSPSP